MLLMILWRGNMNKDIKRYFKECQYLFVYYGKKERKYLDKLKYNINDGSHELNYDEIVERLGSPQEVIMDYYNQENIYELVKKAKFVRTLRNIFILFLILCTLFFSYRAYIYQKTYDEVKDSNNSYFEETIEIIE